MNEELEVLKTVTARLGGARIPYMVTGSIAVNFYALPCMTRDIDLVVELSEPDADRLVRLFQEDFYVDRNMVLRAVTQRAMFNMIHHAHVIKVDVIVRKDSDYRREEFARRRAVSVEGHELFIVSPEDLILSKLEWAKEDTDPEIERIYRAMLLARPGEERLKMGCSMHVMAQGLVRASVLEKDPQASPADIRRALLLRFYDADFDPWTRAKILQALE